MCYLYNFVGNLIIAINSSESKSNSEEQMCQRFLQMTSVDGTSNVLWLIFDFFVLELNFLSNGISIKEKIDDTFMTIEYQVRRKFGRLNWNDY